VPDRQEYERRFRRAGLPLFIAGHSAATDAFNRGVPFLTLVFTGELLGALNLDWSPLANVAAVLGALAIVLVSITLLNRSRGRRALAIPQDIGRAELAGFVLIPALLPLVFGGQWRSALVTAVANLVLLALVYGVFGYGLASIVRWALARLGGQLKASLSLLTRAIPLLMIFSVVLFLTTEMWQVFTHVSGASLAFLGVLFVLLGAAFLLARLPSEVRDLERQAGEGGEPLERRQRLNVGLVLFVSQSLQVLTVSLAVGAFFVALGIVTIDDQILKEWIGPHFEPHVLVTLRVFGHQGVITAELLRVSGAIAAFTGLYFAISMLTDDVYRREFLGELTDEMRESFAARVAYLRLVSA
jgi:uncharacterized membrane protein